MADVEHSHAGETADLVTDARAVLVLAGRLALMVAVGHDERGKPADPRRTAQQVEVALEARGPHHFRAVDGLSTLR